MTFGTTASWSPPVPTPDPARNSEPGSGCSAPAGGGHDALRRKKESGKRGRKKRKKKKKQKERGRKTKRKKHGRPVSLTKRREKEEKEDSHLAFSVSPIQAVRVFYVRAHWSR